MPPKAPVPWRGQLHRQAYLRRAREGYVQCGRYPCNLHSAWDSGLIEHTGMDEEAYVAHLEQLISQEHLRTTCSSSSFTASSNEVTVGRAEPNGIGLPQFGLPFLPILYLFTLCATSLRGTRLVKVIPNCPLKRLKSPCQTNSLCLQVHSSPLNVVLQP